jgi:chromosomal replication initiation ATPase DnaA
MTNLPKIKLADALAAVLSFFRLKRDDVLAPGRGSRRIAASRQLGMWAGRILTDASLPKIAMFFRKKDHTTVYHAFNAVPLRESELTLLRFERRVMSHAARRADRDALTERPDPTRAAKQIFPFRRRRA